jgi:hypothetical protein
MLHLWLFLVLCVASVGLFYVVKILIFLWHVSVSVRDFDRCVRVDMNTCNPDVWRAELPPLVLPTEEQLGDYAVSTMGD